MGKGWFVLPNKGFLHRAGKIVSLYFLLNHIIFTVNGAQRQVDNFIPVFLHLVSSHRLGYIAVNINQALVNTIIHGEKAPGFNVIGLQGENSIGFQSYFTLAKRRHK